MGRKLQVDLKTIEPRATDLRTLSAVKGTLVFWSLSYIYMSLYIYVCVCVCGCVCVCVCVCVRFVQ